MKLNGQEVPVLSRGNSSWIFIGDTPWRIPRPLTAMPKFLSWLLQDAFRPQATNTLEATLIPNMICNLGCGYCFQTKQAAPGAGSVQRVANYIMTPLIIEATAGFIEQERLRHGQEGVSVVLFGGEPLLNIDRCVTILTSIKELRRAGVVTNGVLLTPDAAQKLAQHGVEAIHVSLDGAQADHDAVRVRTAGGGGTYETIIRNLQDIDVSGLFPSRTLRVNVTKSNIAGLDSLVDDLAKRLQPENWIFYLGLIHDNESGWRNVVAGRSVDEQLAAVARRAAKAGFQMPGPETGGCSYCSTGGKGLVVDANGKLYANWTGPGHPEMSVGNVWKGYQEGNEEKWRECHSPSSNFEGPAVRRDSELNWFLREWMVTEGARVSSW